MTDKHTDEIITGGGVWRVHLPNLLKEIGGNPQVSILKQPLNILGKIIFDLAERATKINDPALNKIMIQLTLYSVADPLEPDYDAEVVHSYLYGDAGKVKAPECKSVGSDILDLLHDLRFRLENMPPDPAEDENLVSRIMQATDRLSKPAPDVPELVRYRLNSLGELVYSENGSYVLHSQAAEIIAAKDAEIYCKDNALRLYADISKYPAPLTGGMGALWEDCGQIARDALKGSECVIDDALIERVARAIATSDEQNGGAPYDAVIKNKHSKNFLFDQAKAALAAISK